MRDYYDLLGVDRTADAETIEAAFRERVRELHPDQDGDGSALVDLKRAREVLTNPALRKDYDRLGHRDFIERERSARAADVDLRSSRDDRRSRDGDAGSRRSRSKTATRRSSRGTDRRATPDRNERTGGDSREALDRQKSEQWNPDLDDEFTDPVDGSTDEVGQTTTGDRFDTDQQPDSSRQGEQSRQDESSGGAPAGEAQTTTGSTSFGDDSVVDLDEVADVGRVDPDEILEDEPIDGAVADEEFDPAETNQADGPQEVSHDEHSPEPESSAFETERAESDDPSSPDSSDWSEEPPSQSQASADVNTAETPEPATPEPEQTESTDIGAEPGDAKTGTVDEGDATPDDFAPTTPSESQDSEQAGEARPGAEYGAESFTEPDQSDATASSQMDPAGFGTTSEASDPSQTDTSPSESFGNTDPPTEDPDTGSATDTGQAASTNAEGVDLHAPAAGTAAPTDNSGSVDGAASSTGEMSGSAEPMGADSEAFGTTGSAETDGGTTASPGIGRRLVAPVLAVPALFKSVIPTPNVGGAVGALRSTVGSEYRSDAAGQMAVYAWVGRFVITAVLWGVLSTIAPGITIVPTTEGTAIGVLALSIGLAFLCYDLVLALGANVEPGCHGPISKDPPVGGIAGLVVLYLGGVAAVGIAAFDAPVLRTVVEPGVGVATVENAVLDAPYHTALAVIGIVVAVAAVCALAVVWWYLPWTDRFDRGVRVLPGLWQLPVLLAALVLVWAGAGGTVELPALGTTVGVSAAVGVVAALPIVALVYLGWRSIREPATTTW